MNFIQPLTPKCVSPLDQQCINLQYNKDFDEAKDN